MNVQESNAPSLEPQEYSALVALHDTLTSSLNMQTFMAVPPQKIGPSCKNDHRGEHTAERYSIA